MNPKTKHRPQGIVASLVTPFDNSGNYNQQGFIQNVEHVLDAQVSGVCVGGGTGELLNLGLNEYEGILHDTVGTVGDDAFVIAGAMFTRIEEILRTAEFASDLGVDCLMLIIPPFSNLTTPLALEFLHYLLDKLPMPAIVFNSSSRAGLRLGASELAELVNSHTNCLGVKEAVGSIDAMTTLVAELQEDKRVLIGFDEEVYPGLLVGAHGTLNSLGAVAPKTFVRLQAAAEAGDHELALAIHQRVTAWSAHVYSKYPSPVGIKVLLEALGQTGGNVRWPLSMPQQAESYTKNLLDIARDIAAAEAEYSL